MRKRQSLVSVVMPVYNAGQFLAESIESILNQTYKNFEFLIIDDASNDNSREIIKRYQKKHSNIILLQNKRRLGISETVKKVISKTKGEFIARMDADDVAVSDRLEKQVKYLSRHHETVAVGGQCLIIDKDSRITGKKIFPTDFSDIYRYIFRFIPVQQPTLMIAAQRLPKNFEYYRDGMNTAEEVELIFKLFKYGKVENLPDVVLCYRIHQHNSSLINIRQTFFLTLVARLRAIFQYGYKPDWQGLVITFIQAVAVLLMPTKLTLFLYKIFRKLNFVRYHNSSLSQLTFNSSVQL
ncbi:glycosyltransferase family 2 protein [Candidatus Microgenomates bacterium]|nr:glycosyltransferase family 2 protein [Candidatus Microgenomates bacterium]